MAPRKLSLVTLPPEMLHHICSMLEVKEVRSFRLTCRLIASVAACYALPELVWFMHKGDFEVLRTVAADPIYSKHVRSLVYITDTLPPELIKFKDYVAARRAEDRTRRLYCRYNCPDRYTYARFPSPGDGPPHFPAVPQETAIDVIRASYREYKRMLQQQNEVLDQRLDFEVLRDVLPSFTGLQHVLVSTTGTFCGNRTYRAGYPYRRLSCCSTNWLRPSAVRHLTAVMEAVVNAHIALRSLSVGLLHWSFFGPDGFDTSQLADLCHKMTRFELKLLSVGPGERQGGEGHPNDGGESATGKCRRAMRAGAIRNVLEYMPNLEVLTISFVESGHESTSLMYPASLQDLIPAGHTWPNLERLRLDMIETSRQELIDFLLRHKESLMELCLRGVRLVKTSWLKFLPQLKADLNTALMHDVRVAGLLLGQRERRAYPRDDGDDDVFDDPDEMWDLGNPDFILSPDDMSLRIQITKYMLDPSCDACPLTEQNIGEGSWY